MDSLYSYVKHHIHFPKAVALKYSHPFYLFNFCPHLLRPLAVYSMGDKFSDEMRVQSRDFQSNATHYQMVPRFLQSMVGKSKSGFGFKSGFNQFSKSPDLDLDWI